MSDDEPIGRLARFGPPTLDPTEVCELAGVDRDVGDRLWRALGFPDVPEGVIAYNEEDARALRLAAEGLDRLQTEDREPALRVMLQEARMLSAHLAALAETELDAIGALMERGLRGRLIKDAVDRGLAESDLGWLILYGLRRQLDAVARRRADADGKNVELAVAFVDLSGFTELSERTQLPELAALLDRFESLAFDTVAEAQGRVVKLIGDEVMFVCADPANAAEAALQILERCGPAEVPNARVGLAHGLMLRQGGDYYGRPVNIASRITQIGEPQTVVVDRRMRSLLQNGSDYELQPLGEHPLKGLGTTELWLVRRDGAP